MIVGSGTVERASCLISQPLELQAYRDRSLEELAERTTEAKRKLGDRVLVLGHNYQRDEVIRHADVEGDSLKLSQIAAERSHHEFIVFCGVHFMAETADILSKTGQTVILPDLAAGCSMADMAQIEQVDEAWAQLGQILPVEETVTPVVYVNSAADLKAFCGEHGGITCTSSNARRVIEWAWARREKILFFPDEHLGRNTANKMGIPREEMVVWGPFLPDGGNAPDICWAMENLAEGHVVNQISVPDEDKHWARIALQRMLDVSVPA